MTHSQHIHASPVGNQLLLIVGIVGAFCVGIGEWMLHFLPEGPGGEISMLDRVPLSRAHHGHFFAVFGAPLYFAGYYAVMRIFSSTSYFLSRTLLVLGIYAFAIGGVWISSRYFGAVVFQQSAGSSDYDYYLESYKTHYQTLVWSLRICVLLISVVYVTLIVQNRMGFPKWMAILNPALLLGIVISTLIWVKPLGVHLAPAAMNVVHLIFFGSILYQYHKLQNRRA